ncbi:MAG: hypothetical protein ACLVJ6_07375 [Merdibacter sp.]
MVRKQIRASARDAISGEVAVTAMLDEAITLPYTFDSTTLVVPADPDRAIRPAIWRQDGDLHDTAGKCRHLGSDTGRRIDHQRGPTLSAFVTD